MVGNLASDSACCSPLCLSEKVLFMDKVLEMKSLHFSISARSKLVQGFAALNDARRHGNQKVRDW